MCFNFLKKHKSKQDEELNVNVSVDFDNSSVRPTHSSEEVFYIIRVNIRNNEDFGIVCGASLEQGVLQGKDVSTWESNPQKVIQGMMLPIIPVSKDSFGKEPVRVESHASITGNFVFRLKPNKKPHGLTITIKNENGVFICDKDFIV